jgi:hypothetical protein
MLNIPHAHRFSLLALIFVIAMIPIGIFSWNINSSSCRSLAGQLSTTIESDRDKALLNGTGKLKVFASNPRYFQDVNGQPVFFVGPYTFWGPLSFLKGRSNYYRLGVDGIDSPLHWRRRNPWPRVVGSGKTSTGIEGKFDLTKFDEVYFAELRHFIADAHAHGIYVHISFFNEILVKYKPKCCGFGRHPFGNGNHVNHGLVGRVDRNNDLSGMGSNEFYDADALWGRIGDSQRLAVADLQKKFVEKVLLETRDFPNVFYEIGNEISASHDWLAYWVTFIRARTNNPISIDDTHDKGFHPLTNRRYPVDAATYHTGDVMGDTMPRSIPNDAYRHNKILGNDTDGIGRTINRHADQNRQGAWLTLVSGGSIWGDYFDGWALEDFPDEVAYFGHLLHFLDVSQLPYWVMVPCHALTKKGRLLAKPGERYLAYSTTGGTFTIDLSDASGMLFYEWYNPRTGEFTTASTISGGASHTFPTPDNHDWALHISSTPIAVRSVAPRSAVNDAVLWRDNFEDGNSDGWFPTGGNWEVCQPGGFTKVYCKTTDDDSLAIAGDSTWRDYTVQASVVLSDENGGVAILGRVQNDSQHYQLSLKRDQHTGARKWWLSKTDGEAVTHIASGDYDFIAGAFYYLRLEMHGSQLTASVAAEMGTGHTFMVLGSGTDTRFAMGKIGVQAWGSAAKFDEIRVISASPSS